MDISMNDEQDEAKDVSELVLEYANSPPFSTPPLPVALKNGEQQARTERGNKSQQQLVACYPLPKGFTNDEPLESEENRDESRLEEHPPLLLQEGHDQHFWFFSQHATTFPGEMESALGATFSQNDPLNVTLQPIDQHGLEEVEGQHVEIGTPNNTSQESECTPPAVIQTRNREEFLTSTSISNAVMVAAVLSSEIVESGPPIADDGNDSAIILQDPGVMPIIPYFTQVKEEDDTRTIFNHDLLRIRQSTDNQESNSAWIVGDPRHKKSTPGAAMEPEVRKALQLKIEDVKVEVDTESHQIAADLIDPNLFEQYLPAPSQDVPQFQIFPDDDSELANQCVDEPPSRPSVSPGVPLNFTDSNKLHQYVDELLSSFNLTPSSEDALVDIVSSSASSIFLQENIESDFSATEDFPSSLSAAAQLNSSLAVQTETSTNQQKGRLTPPATAQVVDAVLLLSDALPTIPGDKNDPVPGPSKQQTLSPSPSSPPPAIEPCVAQVLVEPSPSSSRVTINYYITINGDNNNVAVAPAPVMTGFGGRRWQRKTEFINRVRNGLPKPESKRSRVMVEVESQPVLKKKRRQRKRRRNSKNDGGQMNSNREHL